MIILVAQHSTELSHLQILQLEIVSTLTRGEQKRKASGSTFPQLYAKGRC